jgi:hypothetical protein
MAFEKLGEHIAVELGVVLADIDAATTMAEFLDIASVSRGVMDGGDALSISFDSGAVLVIVSGHPAGAEMPWDKVTRCKIEDLEIRR